MKVKRLKEIIGKLDDNSEVMIRNTVNPCGNIQDLAQVELSTYMFFGLEYPCIILNTVNSKEVKEDENGDLVDFISNNYWDEDDYDE